MGVLCAFVWYLRIMQTFSSKNNKNDFYTGLLSEILDNHETYCTFKRIFKGAKFKCPSTTILDHFGIHFRLGKMYLNIG
jgi:hypothetical protein